MITVYTNEAYLKFYNIFKEFNLFELADAYWNCDYRDNDKKYAAEIKLLTTWISMRKKYFNELTTYDNCRVYYNLSKENLSLYRWMNSCLNDRTPSYCRTCSNFQVHYMKHNKTFIASTPDGVSQVTIQNILDRHVYEEYLDYNMFMESQKRDVEICWRESSVHAAIRGLSCNNYNTDDILSCIRCVRYVWDNDLKDQTEDTAEDDQTEDTIEDDQEEDDE